MTVAGHEGAPEEGRRAMVWLALVCAAIASALTLAATRLGIGATPDSGHYVAAAHSLVAGRGFIRLGPEVMASWPPGYPTVLAAAAFVGADVLVWARVVNVLLIGCCAATMALWVHARTRSTIIGFFAGLVTAVGPPMVFVASLALTETLYIALQTGALLTADRWLERPTRRRLAACTVAVALACLTRYQGVAVMASVAASIIILGPGPLFFRVRTAAIVAVASSLPLALWLVRNVLLTGTVTGPRFVPEYGPATAAIDLGTQAMAWFLPWRVLLFHPLAGIVLFAAACGSSLLLARGRPSEARRLAALGAISLVMLSAATILIATRSSMDALGDRLLSPLFPCFVLAAAGAAAVVVSSRRGRARMLPAILSGLAAFAIVGVLTARSAAQVTRSWRDGPGGDSHSNVNTARWRSSPTLHWAKHHLAGELLIASSPAAVYLTAGLQARPIPRKHVRRSPGVAVNDLPVLQGVVQSAGEAYLIVNPGVARLHTFSVDELSRVFKLEAVRTFDDGAVFRMTTP